jgi:nucleoid-associated protein YgaU
MMTSMVNLAMGFGEVSSLTAETFEEVLIGSGDTLWQIASDYAAESQDVRELIYQICKVNGISADSIYPGQLIRIPVES